MSQCGPLDSRSHKDLTEAARDGSAGWRDVQDVDVTGRVERYRETHGRLFDMPTENCDILRLRQGFCCKLWALLPIE